MAKKPAKKQPVSIEAIECNSTSGSKLIGVTQQYFNQLVRDGWIKSLGKNRYRLGDVVQGYKAFLQDEHRRTQKSASASRVQDARAANIELQTMKELGKLIEVEEVQAFLSDTIGTLRSEFSGVAAASTRDLDQRAAIEKNLNAAIDRCRASFEAASAAVADGKPIALDGDETDT